MAAAKAKGKLVSLLITSILRYVKSLNQERTVLFIRLLLFLHQRAAMRMVFL